MSPSPCYLLLGTGYTLTRVASLLPPNLALLTTTSPDKVSAFQTHGLPARLLDYRESGSFAGLFAEFPDIEVIVDSIPPRTISPVPQVGAEHFQPKHGAEPESSEPLATWLEEATLGVRNLVAYLQSAPNKVRRIIYLSTTGVYGITDGSEVNEASPTLATSAPALARVSSENCYRELALGKEALGKQHIAPQLEVIALRIPAIHGPGRGTAEALRRGTYPLIDDGMRWTNRVEVSQLALLIKELTVAPTGSLPPIINATDGNPRRSIEIVREICSQLGLPLPTPISVAEARRRGMHTVLSNQRVTTLYPELVGMCKLVAR